MEQPEEKDELSEEQPSETSEPSNHDETPAVDRRSLVTQVNDDFAKFIIDYDDFAARFDKNQSVDEPPELARLRNLIKYAITFKQTKGKSEECDSNVTEDEDQSSRIADAFRSQVTSHDVELLQNKLKEKKEQLEKLKSVKTALSNVISHFSKDPAELKSENEKTLYELKKSFVKQQNNLNLTLNLAFPDETSRYRKILMDLLEAYFQDNTEFIKVPTDEAGKTLKNAAITKLVEYNPKNENEYRLRKLF